MANKANHSKVRPSVHSSFISKTLDRESVLQKPFSISTAMAVETEFDFYFQTGSASEKLQYFPPFGGPPTCQQ